MIIQEDYFICKCRLMLILFSLLFFRFQNRLCKHTVCYDTNNGEGAYITEDGCLWLFHYGAFVRYVLSVVILNVV